MKKDRLYTLNKTSIIFNSKLSKLPEINKEYAKVATSRLQLFNKQLDKTIIKLQKEDIKGIPLSKISDSYGIC
jgi:hypothetical protein